MPKETDDSISEELEQVTRDEPQPKTAPRQGAKQKEAAGAYEVGYGRPPTHTQFKKGQSGNPRGRPKYRTAAETSRDLRAIISKALTTQVTTTIDGRSQKVSALEANYLRLCYKAIGGDLASIKFVDQLIKSTITEHEDQRATYLQSVRSIISKLDSNNGEEWTDHDANVIQTLFRLIDLSIDGETIYDYGPGPVPNAGTRDDDDGSPD